MNVILEKDGVVAALKHECDNLTSMQTEKVLIDLQIRCNRVNRSLRQIIKKIEGEITLKSISKVEDEDDFVSETLLATFGYAKGDYMNKCVNCSCIFKGAKLSSQCHNCAEDQVKQAIKWKKKSSEYDCNGTLHKSIDPEITCWHCGKTFLCDAMDATCKLCGAPYDKKRCKEFRFKPKNGGFNETT